MKSSEMFHSDEAERPAQQCQRCEASPSVQLSVQPSVRPSVTRTCFPKASVTCWGLLTGAPILAKCIGFYMKLAVNIHDPQRQMPLYPNTVLWN